MIAKYSRASLIGGSIGVVLQIGCHALIRYFRDQAHAHLATPPEWFAHIGSGFLGGMHYDLLPDRLLNFTSGTP